MKCILLIFISFSSLILNAQKRVNKIIDAQNINTLYIDGTSCYAIKITTAQVNQIQIQAKIDGEHSEDILVISKRQHDSLYLKTGFQPLFKADNDKLSAHKVMSIELELQIPAHLNLIVKSDIAQVTANGVFNSALIELNQGQCRLEKFYGTATINTIRGSIYVETNYATINATSRHGLVNIEPLTQGEYQLHLKSIEGNISVIKTE
ncbi:hypothetical protein FNB79_05260 [Formosa sediminum]|uniref:DUF4097 domain-containing protein n=1 Tax=Formosa sediminum TaxID=2594004 RepID=A0A516GPF9_9FLAO|nr:hypothetical protein [Formosa sediminum]QDO93408.1 hypothetical protein FNB79_05260 [Formosa sediminum]